MNTGEKIKAARKRAGLTQKELGELLGTTPQNIAQYESGRRQPKTETLEKIANALLVDIDEIDGRDKHVITFNTSTIIKATEKAMKAKYPERAGVFSVDYGPDLKTLDLIQKRNRGDKLTPEEVDQLAAYDDTRIQENTKMINTFRHVQLLTAFDRLNENGQTKAVEQVEMLSKIPEYQKENEPK